MGRIVAQIIRNAVRALRATRSMTQQDLATAVGVSRQTIIAIELHGHSTSLKVAFGIANAFDLPVEKVFRYEARD